ncbi:MAG: DUF2723 domain-containing protein [bacterium]|nr:DUF2723 domain-containing protein [bacterium]
MTDAVSSENAPAPLDRLPGAGFFWLLLFVAFLSLYTATASTGIQWQDSGSHILRIFTGQSDNERGLALVHPLHHWLGRLVVWPDVLEPARAITLISALAGAFAVANVFGCVMTLTRRWQAAVLAAVGFGLAHTPWQLATLTETYTLGAALLAGECWCLARYARSGSSGNLVTAMLLNGLGIANHLLAGLTTPVLVVVLIHELRRGRLPLRPVILAAALWLLGSLPYSGLVVATAIETGDVGGTLHSALFGRSYADEVLNLTPSFSGLLVSAAFVCLNFPNLMLPAAVYGLTRRMEHIGPIVRRALLAGLVIHFLFVLRYDIVDQHTFFMPTYVFLAIFAGLGFSAVLSWPDLKRGRHVLAAAAVMLAGTPGVYFVASPIARRMHLLGTRVHNKPYRDDYLYLFIPWSVADRSADRMSRLAVELGGEDGLIIVEDGMAEFAVRYRAKRSRRPGLDIARRPTPDEIDAAIKAGRPVVLVPARRDQPRTDLPYGSWKRVGHLYVWTSDDPTVGAPTAPGRS